MPPTAPTPNQPLLPAPPLGNDPPQPSPLRHSSRKHVPPDRYGFFAFFTSLDPISVPTSYSQAYRIPCWQDAMNEELLALESDSTWDFIPTSNSVKCFNYQQQMDF